MAHYRIVEWERYQHYRDRDPPWIKLHRDTLTSNTWVSSDDRTRLLAVVCMLIAAGTENKIPADPKYVMRRAYLDREPDFAPLVDVGFIELVGEINGLAEIRKPMLAPASAVQADACSESEAIQRQSRAEQKDNSTAKRGADRGTRLPEDWTPSEEDCAFAADLGLDPMVTAEEFRDFWTSVPGARGRKLNWSKTFRNRCRELGRRPRGGAMLGGVKLETFEERRQRENRAVIEGYDRDRH